MPKINVNITEENITEWIYSVGYFLPTNDKELSRFERLYGDVQHQLNINLVDPFAILNGSWQPRYSGQVNDDELDQEVSQLRMAARKHEDIPDDIFKKMKRNQDKHDPSDNS